MKIGCLGWGSLLWDSKGLPTRGVWFTDGPFLPIEFARQSKDDRITLVLVDGVSLVRSLWVLLSAVSMDDATKALAKREETPKKHIGVWTPDSRKETGFQQLIGEWAQRMTLDAVVWTALPPRFKKEDRAPAAQEVISHLSALSGDTRKRAEEYIRMAPRQIDTDYRRKIESVFHWSPLSKI